MNKLNRFAILRCFILLSCYNKTKAGWNVSQGIGPYHNGELVGSKQPEGIKNLPVAFFISAPIFSSIKSRIPCAVGVAIRCEQNRGEFTTSTLLLLDFRLTGKPEKVVTNYHFHLRKPVLKSLEKGDFLFC